MRFLLLACCSALLLGLPAAARHKASGAAQQQATLPLHPNVFPNPTNGTVRVVAAPANVPVRVVDPQGRIRASGFTDANGTAELRLPTDLVLGVYVVRCGNKFTHLEVVQ